ncbi:MAG: CopG family antitoxin [Chloroflexota bacterium]
MPKLPEFKTEEELIAWFDTHDTADYIDDIEEIEIDFELIPTSFATRPLELRLHSDIVGAIENLAESRGVPYQLLIRDWLREKITQEAPDLLPHHQ